MEREKEKYTDGVKLKNIAYANVFTVQTEREC